MDDEERQMYEHLETQQSRDFNPYTDCRMYETEFPDTDDLVMVRVTRVTDIGAYVMLLEYNNKVGTPFLNSFSFFSFPLRDCYKNRKESFCFPIFLENVSVL